MRLRLRAGVGTVVSGSLLVAAAKQAKTRRLLAAKAGSLAGLFEGDDYD
jgi:hypothetical protein